jgi:hypothetical protein
MSAQKDQVLLAGPPFLGGFSFYVRTKGPGSFGGAPIPGGIFVLSFIPDGFSFYVLKAAILEGIFVNFDPQ